MAEGQKILTDRVGGRRPVKFKILKHEDPLKAEMRMFLGQLSNASP